MAEVARSAETRHRLLVRARKLLALTGSPSASEAQNAALAACKIIRELGFELVDSPARDAETEPGTRQHARRRRAPVVDPMQPFADMFSEFFGGGAGGTRGGSEVHVICGECRGRIAPGEPTLASPTRHRRCPR